MPNLYIIAGPNGAGKTTAAHVLLPEFLHCEKYINADYIAAGMNPLRPELSAIAAGRVMLNEIHEAMENKVSFAFESTLSSRSFFKILKQAKNSGYIVSIIYLWLRSADIAVERVAQRVAEGGHNVPEKTIRRRYERSIKNFFELYMPLADNWTVYDNYQEYPALVANLEEKSTKVKEEAKWKIIKQMSQ